MKEPMELKRAVHAQCLNLLKARIHEARSTLEQAQEAGRSDTKSSAGDKHETARAMAQIEIEKQANAMRYLHELEAQVRGVDPLKRVERVASGALLSTDGGNFYVCAALGAIVVDGITVQTISLQAPILAAFANVAIGGAGAFRGKHYRLLRID